MTRRSLQLELSEREGWGQEMSLAGQWIGWRESKDFGSYSCWLGEATGVFWAETWCHLNWVLTGSICFMDRGQIVERQGWRHKDQLGSFYSNPGEDGGSQKLSQPEVFTDFAKKAKVACEREESAMIPSIGAVIISNKSLDKLARAFLISCKPAFSPCDWWFPTHHFPPLSRLANLNITLSSIYPIFFQKSMSMFQMRAMFGKAKLILKVL